MTEFTEDQDFAERIAADADEHKSAWDRTLDDFRALGEDLEENGWDVSLVVAGHTAPEPPGEGVEGRYGLVYVIPKNHVERFTDAIEDRTFPKYDVYRNRVAGREFIVTELLDPDTETAILLAGNYEIRHAAPLATHAEETGEMFTHVQTLDGTPLGSFKHDEVEKFFPDVETIKRWNVAAVDE